eukprot:597772-Rhodomonas_salina.2
MDRQQAGGRSTCYLKVSQDCSTMTAVNYWDAKVCVLPLTESGEAKVAFHHQCSTFALRVSTDWLPLPVGFVHG